MAQSQKLGILYCDGASRGNPGPGGWGYVLSLGSEVTEAGGAENPTTNNRMELRAVLEALLYLQTTSDRASIRCYLDSQYVLKGVTSFIYNWQKNDWLSSQGEAVKNQDLWKPIVEVLKELSKRITFKWLHVPGHEGIPGNERADEIACAFADGREIELYHGPLKSYRVDLEPPTSTKQNKYSKPVYLSLIDGEIFRDESWSACEARVRGRKAAKYKKVKSSSEENATLKAWGIKT